MGLILKITVYLSDGSVAKTYQAHTMFKVCLIVSRKYRKNKQANLIEKNGGNTTQTGSNGMQR